MSKFVNMLTGSDASIKKTRATQLSDDTQLEVDAFITNLKREKSKLNSKLNSLTDLAPDNTYSLRPGSKDFDAAKWMSELHQTRMDILLLEVKLKEAEAINNDWFGAE
jgi:outer membrane protein TolC